MKALSIQQPWAWLIVAGLPILQSVPVPDSRPGTTRVEWLGKVARKDVENRLWPLPKDFQLPQRIYIHAGKREDKNALKALLDMGFAAFPILALFDKGMPKGALIGEVDIISCVTESESPWFCGPYGFVLSHPIPYDKPIPYRGQLGFFDVRL